MKTVCNKLLSLMLVAVLLVSAVPFQAFATEGETTAPVETTVATEAAVVETTAATEAPVEVTEATEAPVETTAATEAPAPAEESTQETVNIPAEAAIDDTATINYILAGVAKESEAYVAGDHIIKTVPNTKITTAFKISIYQFLIFLNKILFIH